MITVGRWEELRFAAKPGRSAADPFRDASVDAVTVRIVRIEPGSRHAHVHHTSDEITHVISGTGWHHQGDETVAVGPGDTVHVPTGVPHATVAAESMAVICFFPHPDPFSETEELERLHPPGLPSGTSGGDPA